MLHSTKTNRISNYRCEYIYPMALDEGYIKFTLRWQQAPSLPDDILHDIIRYRNICYQKQYIGSTGGVGYGNISVRYQRDQFIISGTQTGGLENASAQHFTLVTEVDFENNRVICKGPVKASAESLTHAMIYRVDENIGCVIHIHHREMWNKLKYEVPTTHASVPYGTIDMCHEVEQLYYSSGLKTKKLLVMAGHEEGIISFGKNASEALHVLDEHAQLVKAN